jgi:choline dehydrogenase-like flavoprotein
VRKRPQRPVDYQRRGSLGRILAARYIRGHRSDYDQWASLGNDGWSFADVLQYFKRSGRTMPISAATIRQGGLLAVNKLHR